MTRRTRVVVIGGGVLVVGLLLGYVAVHQALYEALTPPLLGPMEPVRGVGSLSAETCGGCHVTITEEWRGTGHGRATTDPLYVADLAAQDAPYFCDHCHAPLIEQRAQTTSGLWSAWPELIPRADPNPREVSGLRHEGVTCVACHQRDGAMLGSFASDLAPHPVAVSDTLGTEATCRPCHVLDLRGVGDLERPLMDTFGEWEAYRAAGGDQTCVDCHMPALADRPAAKGGPARPAHSHALRGPFDPAFVREGVGAEDMVLTRGATGELRGSLVLVNQTGHRLPTAEPHRKLTVALELLGAEGEVLTRTEQVHQRPVDLHSLSEAPGSDTSLEVRERRALTLTSPAPPAARSARLVVRFVLWDPEDPIARAADLGPESLIHTLYTQTLSLSEP